MTINLGQWATMVQSWRHRRKVARAGRDLMAGMQRIHGGSWTMTIDHDTAFVLIQKRLARRGVA